MANRKSSERNVRKLTKVGKSSFAITLPIELIRKLGWKKKQRNAQCKIIGLDIASPLSKY